MVVRGLQDRQITPLGGKARRAFLLLLVFSLAPPLAMPNSVHDAQANGVEVGDPLSTGSERESSNRTISIDDLVSIRDIRSLVVSPNGRHIAFQVDRGDPAINTYRSAWYVAAVGRNAKARLVDDAGPVHIRQTARGDLWGNILGWPAAWSPDGRWLTYLKKAEGAAQIWRVPIDSGMPEQVTRNAADIMDFTWAPDGSKIYFIVGRDRIFMEKQTYEESKRGYLFDERIDPMRGAVRSWTRCEPAGRRFSMIAHYSAGNRCEPVVWVYEIGSSLERRASDTEAQTYWELRQVDSPLRRVRSWESARDGEVVRSIEPSPRGTSIAWLEIMDPETNTSVFPPLTVSKSATRDRTNPLRCLDKRCTGRIKKLWWRGKTGEIIFRSMESDGVEIDGLEVNRPSLSVLYAWLPSEQSVRTILRTDDSFQQCEMALDRLICLYDTWTQPTRIASIDLESGVVETIFDANTEFASFDFTEVEKIEWSDAQGYKGIGHLVYPAGYEQGQRFPLIVLGYVCTGSAGSSFLRGGTGDQVPIHVMAQHGFAVLCYSMPLLPADQSRLPFLERMIEMLGTREIIDPTRVGISGFSGGASLVEDAIVNSDRFSAAHASWSSTHPAGYYIYHFITPGKRTPNVASEKAVFSAPARYSENSPGVHAQEVHTPLLLQVSDVEIFRALPNYFSLKDAGKPVEMYVFPDEYHVKWQPAHKFAVYKRNLQWFKFWLQGIEESDPLDPQQYVRWREMREKHCATELDPMPVYCGERSD